MSEMNVRSDSVDVEQIMRQIRARIREKRGVDYTEAEVQQLATVKLEKFLDPRGLRSDLVEQYRRTREVSPAPPNYAFGEDTLFETHRGLLRGLRKLLRPLLKLFFNPDKITTALHIQSQVNTQGETRLRRLEEREPLSYELMHNLTVEITRLGIEVHNLKMRVESLSSRLDFDERRSKSLEGVVQYRPGALQRPPRSAAAPAGNGAGATTVGDAVAAPASQPREAGNAQGPEAGNAAGALGERRRRRRRRRRRPGATLADAQGQPGRGPDAHAADEGDEFEGADADDRGESDEPDAPGQ